MIVDRQGRRFRNLRVSLTAACNYACTYCVPNGKRLVAAQDELSADAMARGVAYLIEAAGIERLRITGGEPLVSTRLEPFLRQVSQLGLDDISLTTNGHQQSLEQFQRKAGGRTLRELLMDYNKNGSVELVGTPDQIAERMGEAMEEVGGDGFLFSLPDVSRRCVAEVTDGLVPALQKRGLMRTEYTHAQFRENLLAF